LPLFIFFLFIVNNCCKYVSLTKTTKQNKNKQTEIQQIRETVNLIPISVIVDPIITIPCIIVYFLFCILNCHK